MADTTRAAQKKVGIKRSSHKVRGGRMKVFCGKKNSEIGTCFEPGVKE